MKKLLLIIAIILLFASPVWGANKTAVVYKLNADGDAITATSTDINGEDIDTDSPGQIGISIAAMASAAGSRTVEDSDPDGGHSIVITINTANILAVPTTYFCHNLTVKSLVRMAADWSRDGTFLHEEEGYFKFQNGSHAPVVGETLTGNTSGETFEVVSVEVVSNLGWGGSTTGYIMYKDLSGALTTDEQMNDPTPNDVCDMDGDETAGGRLDELLDYMRVGLIRFPGFSSRAIWDDDNEVDHDGPLAAGWDGTFPDVLRDYDLDRMYSICSGITNCELYMRATNPCLNTTNTAAGDTAFCNAAGDPHPCCDGDASDTDDDCTDLIMWTEFIKHVDTEGVISSLYIDFGNEPYGLCSFAGTAAGGESWADKIDDYIDSFEANKGGLTLKYGSPHTIRPTITKGTDASSYWCSTWSTDHCIALNNYEPGAFIGDDDEGFLYQLDQDSNWLSIMSAHYYQRSSTFTITDLLAWSGGGNDTDYLPHWTLFVDSLEKAAEHHDWSGASSEPLAVVGEFGPTSANDADSESVGAALWLADSLGRAGRAGADAMCFGELTHSRGIQDNAFAQSIFVNDLSEFYPSGLVYIMFDQWFGDEWLTDITWNTGSEGDVGIVAGSSSTDAYDFWIMVINKSQAPKDVKISLGGNYYIDMSAAGDGVLAANTIELLFIDTAPDAVVDNEASMGGTGAKISGGAKIGG